MNRRELRIRVARATGDLLKYGTATGGAAGTLIDTSLGLSFNCPTGMWIAKRNYTSTVIEDCEDVWSEVVDTDADTTVSTDHKVGTYSARFVVGADLAAGDLIASEVITSTDLSGYDYIKLWIKPSVDLGEDELRFLLDDTVLCASPLKTLALPAVQADTWTEVRMSLGDASGITAIISLGFELETERGGFEFLIDSVRAEKGDTLENRQTVAYDPNTTTFNINPSWTTTAAAGDPYEVYRQHPDYYNDLINMAIEATWGKFLLDVEDVTSITLADSTYSYDVPGGFDYIYKLYTDDATDSGAYDIEINRKWWGTRPDRKLYVVESVLANHVDRNLALVGQRNHSLLADEYTEIEMPWSYLYHYLVGAILLDKEASSGSEGRMAVAQQHLNTAERILRTNARYPRPDSKQVL